MAVNKRVGGFWSLGLAGAVISTVAVPLSGAALPGLNVKAPGAGLPGGGTAALKPVTSTAATFCPAARVTVTGTAVG